ncbi:MAG: molybdopterin-guanine dinucleotide biosynthesis protein MobB [Lactobacillus sp.]|jgi:molybdopterin-guanine dinucleotide biosynthesis protein MobB|nr:molybdopterin-guanine dinucleotide biosynthesis protein MobB [Lactobacillus sp.]MCI2032858.1 molybdopterin-guanine dinucleotide biosynthesis protein MobB [Lactobacillus sp.]
MVAPLQVIGHKKSGKTTVMTALIQAAKAFDLRVATIKHTHEAISPDTDSGRFAAQAPTWLLTPTQTLAYQLAAAPLADRIAAIVQTCQADILLIEGAKALDYPKLVLLNADETPNDWGAITNVVAFATLGAPRDPKVLAWRDSQARAWLAAWYTQAGGVTWTD